MPIALNVKRKDPPFYIRKPFSSPCFHTTLAPMYLCSSEAMSKNSNDGSSVQGHHSVYSITHFEFFKKLKRLRPLEPSLGAAGFFVFTLLFISCFFYLDYQTAGRSLLYRGWLGHISQSSGGFSAENKRPGFLDKGGDGCNLFDGNWVWDDTYPLYQSTDCSFIDSGFRCWENGRPDSFFTKCCWQPKHCNLPRFDARLMLEKLRNRRLVFVGDSIGRNQWESLLCMLASAIPDKTSIYEVNGSPITNHREFLSLYSETTIAGLNTTELHS